MLQSISLGDFECKTPYVFHTQSRHPALHWICLHNYGHVIVAQYDFLRLLVSDHSISVETKYSTRYTVIVASLGERLSTSYSCKCFLINSNCNNHPEVS